VGKASLSVYPLLGLYEVQFPTLTTPPPHRRRSMYAQLRTNLPREVMGFSDFWFGEPFVDGRRFCGHQEVKLYVEAFAQHFDLHPLLRLNTRVLTASPVTAAAPALGPAWEVTTQAGGEKPVRQTYDALVVCNGHYSQPRLPQVEGESDFPGLILHSHSYRQKEVFAGQRVVVVGASASGEDIAREVAETAQEVYLSARSWQNPEWATDPNPIGRLWRRPMIRELCADGSAVFTNGETVCGVDTVIYCTGYTYSFPFLAAGETVTVQDNCISPLYEHVFPPQARPAYSDAKVANRNVRDSGRESCQAMVGRAG
jgi:cation diffusion facilitator CzcD-associated flavoprotein CzcO